MHSVVFWLCHIWSCLCPPGGAVSPVVLWLWCIWSCLCPLGGAVSPVGLWLWCIWSCFCPLGGAVSFCFSVGAVLYALPLYPLAWMSEEYDNTQYLIHELYLGHEQDYEIGNMHKNITIIYHHRNYLRLLELKLLKIIQNFFKHKHEMYFIYLIWTNLTLISFQTINKNTQTGHFLLYNCNASMLALSSSRYSLILQHFIT